MVRNSIIVHVIVLISFHVSAAETIEYFGEKYHAKVNNISNLRISSHKAIWTNSESFIKLQFSEHDSNPEQIRKSLITASSSSLNQFQLTHFGILQQSEKITIFKVLIDGTEFIKIHNISGGDSSSLMLTASFPESLTTASQNALLTTLSTYRWTPADLLTISENPGIKISKPSGFYLTQSYANSLVFRSSADNTELPDAILIFSFISRAAQTKSLTEETKNILESAQSVEQITIHSISNEQRSNDKLVRARASGTMSDSQVKVDISHVSKALNNSILIAQLITVEHTESFLRLEELLTKALDGLYFEKINLQLKDKTTISILVD